MSYQDAQFDTDDRLAMLARLAKLRRHDANLTELTEPSNEIQHLHKRGIEGEAIETLNAHMIEYLAVETVKSGDRARDLTLALKKRVKQMGRLLSHHVGDGSDRIGERRALLERAAEYTRCSPHKNRVDFTDDNQEIADVLNQRQNSFSRPPVLRPITRAEPVERGTKEAALRVEFDATSARKFIDAFGHLEQVTKTTTRQMLSLYADPSRDDVSRFRGRPALDQEIARLEQQIPRVGHAMAEAWPQTAVPRARGTEQRDPNAPAVREGDFMQQHSLAKQPAGSSSEKGDRGNSIQQVVKTARRLFNNAARAQARGSCSQSRGTFP